MKLNNPFGYFSGKLFLLSFLVLGITASYSVRSSAAEDLAFVNQQLLEIELPDLPQIKDSKAYLYSPDEVFTVQLILRLGKRQVEVYEQDELVATYPVAVGKKGWETPTGDFEVIQMIKNPSWQNPWNGKVIPAGANNPLGERWIGFWTDGKNTIGFHGTPGEHLIGQAVSHGCVRMKNKDIRELFEFVSVGISVQVIQ